MSYERTLGMGADSRDLFTKDMTSGTAVKTPYVFEPPPKDPIISLFRDATEKVVDFAKDLTTGGQVKAPVEPAWITKLKSGCHSVQKVRQGTLRTQSYEKARMAEGCTASSLYEGYRYFCCPAPPVVDDGKGKVIIDEKIIDLQKQAKLVAPSLPDDQPTFDRPLCADGSTAVYRTDIGQFVCPEDEVTVTSTTTTSPSSGMSTGTKVALGAAAVVGGVLVWKALKRRRRPTA